MRLQAAAMAVVLGVAGMAFGATDQTQASHEVVAAGGLPRDLMAAPVTAAPFSAVWTNEVVKTLADGTKMTKHGHHLVARDSAGRERVEMRLGAAKDGKPEVKLVFVIDPVARSLTTWVEGANGPKVATVAKMKDKSDVTPVAAPRPKPSDSRPQLEVTKQDLGSQTIDNLVVTGEMTTTVIPAGRVGNDQPLTMTHEVWTSDEMKLVLLQKWSDPRSGVRTTQLADFKRAEPDAALFRVPAGYQVKTAEETLRELAQKLENAADAQE
jgi:hypothetical protein